MSGYLTFRDTMNGFLGTQSNIAEEGEFDDG